MVAFFLLGWALHELKGLATTIGVSENRIGFRTRIIKLLRNLFRKPGASEELDIVAKELTRIIKEAPYTDKKGLDFSTFEIVREYLRKTRRTADGWKAFESSLVDRRKNENEFVRSTEDAGKYFTEGRLLGSSVNKKFWMAFPGILTGIGLLATFYSEFCMQDFA